MVHAFSFLVFFLWLIRLLAHADAAPDVQVSVLGPRAAGHVLREGQRLQLPAVLQAGRLPGELPLRDGRTRWVR